MIQPEKSTFRVVRRACVTILSLAPAVLLAWFASGCDRKEVAPHLSAVLPVVAVHVAVAREQSRAAVEEGVGTVGSALRASVEAKISARIERMLATPGKVVKAGDVLVQLDGREIQSRLDQPIPVLQQSEIELKRFKMLVEQNAAARAELDAAEARFRVAGAAVREAQTLLTYTTIAAPFDGVITRKLADVGDHAAPGRPLVEIEDPHVLRVETDIPESLIHHIRAGAKLRVSVPNVAERGIEASVSEIAPAADPATRTFLVKADLPGDAALRAGQFVRVLVPRGESRALVLPYSAVVPRGQMETVFVVASNVAQLRLVKTGRRTGNDVELVSGLTSGEKVVVDAGSVPIRDGQPVEVEP